MTARLITIQLSRLITGKMISRDGTADHAIQLSRLITIQLSRLITMKLLSRLMVFSVVAKFSKFVAKFNVMVQSLLLSFLCC